MQKGEYAISVALAGVMVLAILAIERRWQPMSLREMATSAEEFLRTTTGIGGQVPQLAGYEIVRTFRLDRYRAALYRASPAPLVFAPGRFTIYNRGNQPVFKLETLEGSKDAWTALYNFAHARGLTLPGSRTRSNYTRNLTGQSDPHVVIGQYTGGDRCCTTATIVELGKEEVRVVGRVEGLEGLPFEGLEFRKVDNNPAWEIIAHRPARTLCGSPEDAADVLSLYAYADGKYVDQTGRFANYFENILRQNLTKWGSEKNRSLQLLQTLALNYAALGQREQAKRFFAMNFTHVLPELQKLNSDPNVCLEDMANLVDRLPPAVTTAASR